MADYSSCCGLFLLWVSHTVQTLSSRPVAGNHQLEFRPFQRNMRWRLLCRWDSVSRTVARHETVFALRMLVRHLLKPILSLARERRTI
ncbi:hypothetical protein CH063_13718, partial [Colletotrichum higginsianum]